MKKFAAFALLLSLATMTIGCKPAEKKEAAPAEPAAGAPAETPAATPPAEEPKKE
jgi:hypothetical protein